MDDRDLRAARRCRRHLPGTRSSSTYGFGAWRLLPSTPGRRRAERAPSRSSPRPARPSRRPENVGGDVKLATFNVLNFFPTTGNEFVSSGLGTCTYFTDREGNQITNNSCNPNGPRGAANAANLERQQDKIVSAINTANADVVSLEELENSVEVRQAAATSRSTPWSTR